MKKKEKNVNAAEGAEKAVKASHKVRKGFLIGLSLFGIFAATAATTFLTTEGKVTVIDLRTGESGGDTPIMSGRDRFISNLASSATEGLNIKVTDIRFDQFYVDKDGNEDTSKGHNTITNGIDENGNKAPISVALKMDELSLHGINLAVTAPIAYSNNGKDAKYRGVHASLLPYSFDGETDEQTLFVNLFDNGNDVFALDEGGEPVVTRSSGGSWDFKYRVGVDSKDSTFFDEHANVTDQITRGTEYYEYGELDWFLADIFEILSDGAISVDFGSLISGLFSKDNASNKAEVVEEEETSGDSSNEEEGTSEPSGISIDDIMASMGEMQDIGTEGAPYFVWELPLGDTSIVLGLGGDSNYNLSSVDLPAKAVKGEDGVYVPSSTPVDPWEIKAGMTLSAHAEINGNLPSTWANEVYGDPADYRKLTDSASLFKRVAKLVAKPEIDVSASFEIGHNEEAVEGSRTVLRKDAVSEAMTLDLSAGVDLYDNENKEYALEGIDVDVKIDQKHEGNDFTGHEIQVAYLQEEDDAQVSAYNAYVNVNDVLLAKTSKTYLDELITDIKESTFFTESDDGDKESDGISLDNFLDLLGDDIKAILNSDLVNGIKEGSYTAIADLIDFIKAEDNRISIGLSLAPLGLDVGEGENKTEIVLSLDGVQTEGGDYVSSLASLTLKNVNFGNFSLNGTLNIDGLEGDLVAPEAPEGKEFESLSHLRGIFGTVEKIADSKSFAASLSGAAYDEEGEKALEIKDSGLAFNFNEGKTSGKIDVELDTYGEVNQQHNIALGLQNVQEGEGEDLHDEKYIGFSYDSISNKEGFVSQKSENKVAGKIGLTAAKNALKKLDLGNLLGFFGNDDRFSRLGKALIKEESGSLLSDILNGQYFGLLKKQGIISSFTLGSTTKVVIDGSKVGLEGTSIELEILYENNEVVEEEGNEKIVEGGLSGLNVTMLKDGEKSFEMNIGDIAPMEDNTQEFVPFENIDGMDDFTPMVDLAGELLNTLTLGVSVGEDEAKAKTLTGISNYGLEGAVGLEIVGDKTELYRFKADAAVEGAETKLAVNFGDIPVIRGINGPNSDIYFRPNELEGKRDSNLYFYANGVNPEGEFLLTRDSSYGRVRNVKDAVRLSGKDYTNDFVNWLLEYSLGVEESLLAKDEEEPVEEQATVEETSSSSWNPFANGVHIADCWGGFHADSSVAGQTTYTLSLSLGKLLGMGILGDASVSFVSNDLKQGAFSGRCLSEVHVNAGVDVTSVQNTTMHIASVAIDLGLTNVGTPDEEGYSEILSVLAEGSDYANLFVGTVDDSGLMDHENTVLGDLYNLKNGFQSDDVNNPYYAVYGYNLLGLEDVKAGNYYLGL